jgi:hypothetical protein
MLSSFFEILSLHAIFPFEEKKHSCDLKGGMCVHHILISVYAKPSSHRVLLSEKMRILITFSFVGAKVDLNL